MATRVVVTGMGTVNALGNSLEEFWQAVQSNTCGITAITRFDASECDARVAGEVKNFNPADFMDRKASRRMALFTQYAVAASGMAWRDAGLTDAAINMERAGVIMGNGIGGMEVDDDAHIKLQTRGPGRIPPMTVPKMIMNEAAGNVSMALGLKGPAHTVATACASATDAIGTALDAVRAGRMDVVVTGGTESTLTAYGIGGFQVIKALSTSYNDTPEKASRPFDANRDGFVMGEGAGILILESEEHAKARGARIYAEVAGYGSTADAYHLTAPEPGGAGAARAIRLALADAGLQPTDIDYINAHGTSTPINDPTETAAIRAAFGEHADSLKVSSTKGMTGHCLGAAGGVEAIASILAIRDQFFPATLNYETPDPECDLDYVPNTGVSGRIRAALSTSLGFGGHNGVLCFKEMS